MAEYRVIEPFLDFGDSGAVERGSFELTEKELRDFLNHGVKRELIMLKRASDLTRAQSVAQMRSESLLKKGKKPDLVEAILKNLSMQKKLMGTVPSRPPPKGST